MLEILGFWVPPAEAVTLALAVLLAALVSLIAYRAWRRHRVTPHELERRRRAAVVAGGKLGDAYLVEMRDDLLFYSYDVRGVEYTASQDISALKQYMPPDLSVAVGPVLIKYDPRNPANSVVLSEGWNGLRTNHIQEPTQHDTI